MAPFVFLIFVIMTFWKTKDRDLEKYDSGRNTLQGAWVANTPSSFERKVDSSKTQLRIFHEVDSNGAGNQEKRSYGNLGPI